MITPMYNCTDIAVTDHTEQQIRKGLKEALEMEPGHSEYSSIMEISLG